MSRSQRTLALGVDLGASRVRVALAERSSARVPYVVAVAGRDVAGDADDALRSALEELATAERRCVLALSVPDARLHAIALPPMPAAERRRAAAYEATRFGEIAGADAHVTLAELETPGRWAVGVARRSALARGAARARAARLRAIAVDDSALALRRAHPNADAIVDIGTTRTTLAVFRAEIPHVAAIPIGGDALTDGIAISLGISRELAEERKRFEGFAGAGETQRDALLAALLEALRELGTSPSTLRDVVLTGNGSRVPGLPDAFARAAGAPVRLGALDAELSPHLPADVLHAAGPDWSLAVGLALWEVAG